MRVLKVLFGILFLLVLLYLALVVIATRKANNFVFVIDRSRDHSWDGDAPDRTPYETYLSAAKTLGCSGDQAAYGKLIFPLPRYQYLPERSGPLFVYEGNRDLFYLNTFARRDFLTKEFGQVSIGGIAFDIDDKDFLVWLRDIEDRCSSGEFREAFRQLTLKVEAEAHNDRQGGLINE